jgi:4-hydroxythreonine-4-phosphate dehydrogenase
MTKPTVITPGEPAGIGPDITLKIVQNHLTELTAPLLIIADENLLHARAKQMGISIPKNLQIHHVPLKTTCIAGNPDAKNAAYVLETLKIAANGCLQQQYQAMVTGPVNKAVINEAGFEFSGHTDWLANLLHVKQTVMLFATEKNKFVALYTTHIPLSEVPHALNTSTLQHCLEILYHGLQNYFHIASPRIAVLGLNPHAGEQGVLGKEEITIINPVIQTLQQRGWQLTGPIAADTAFTAQTLKNYDAILAMYHDQGLPAIKACGFGHLVNATLGLPIIRTSVDHGTAFDLAGTGKADENSLLAAIKLAEKMHRT